MPALQAQGLEFNSQYNNNNNKKLEFFQKLPKILHCLTSFRESPYSPLCAQHSRVTQQAVHGLRMTRTLLLQDLCTSCSLCCNTLPWVSFAHYLTCVHQRLLQWPSPKRAIKANTPALCMSAPALGVHRLKYSPYSHFFYCLLPSTIILRSWGREVCWFYYAALWLVPNTKQVLKLTLTSWTWWHISVILVPGRLRQWPVSNKIKHPLSEWMKW